MKRKATNTTRPRTKALIAALALAAIPTTWALGQTAYDEIMWRTLEHKAKQAENNRLNAAKQTARTKTAATNGHKHS